MEQVEQLCSRLLGQPQENVQQAIKTFVQEFEVLPQIDHVYRNLGNATIASLKELQESIAQSNQKQPKSANPTQLAKAAFQADIDEAREAFDQEMVLRHADVVKQYVGAFVQQIDHY
ncbi:hypothetical protein BGZ83_010324 [Gryganskiella cystojenkinii]|nr:hypothetical protein BGZ83_010324 [Gryganskiella cystojenkinii]